MKAVVIGAGRIGCGLAGQLFRSSGLDVTFITRNPETAANLNRNGKYHVLATSANAQQKITVDGIRAIHASDTGLAIAAIAEADVIATAVRVENLPAVAPLIAAGLSGKKTRSNVIAFENMEHVGACLRGLVAAAMAHPEEIEKHGFSGAVISRIVTRRIGNPGDDAPVTFVGDMVEEFIVDRTTLREPLPLIAGMKAVDNYHAFVLRKLYTFSAGHATAAYLGWLKGYHYIHTAIRDREIRRAVLAAMEEGQRGLAARFGKEFAGGPAELQAIVARFENAAINDPIDRVARDPHRKLGASERLVGAARMAEAAGIIPEQLALATAAALCFCGVGQHGNNCQVRAECAEVTAALNQICGLDAAHGFGRSVACSWELLAPSLLPGNLLLSLNSRMWARI